MKNIIFIALAIAIFAGCKNNENGSFTVSGNIKKPPSDSIYLQQLSYTTPDIKTVDSAKINSDGSYTLKGVSPQQNLFVISFKNNPVIILVNDAPHIKVNFDAAGFNYPEITGSDATNELYSFIRNFCQKDSILAFTYYQLDSLSKNHSGDSNTLKNLQLQYTKQLNDLDDAITRFVSSSKNPAAICFVIDKAKGAVTPEELNALVESASKRFPQHTGLAAFKVSVGTASAVKS